MKVHIVGTDSQVQDVFSSYGFACTSSIDDAGVVVWTGGADINPKLYGQEPIRGIHFNPARDQQEIQAFGKSAGKFRIGICRGAQLLNVLSGGSMFQNVNNHAGRIHDMVEKSTGRIIRTNSIHHQMMRPSREATLIATAPGISNYREDDEFEYEGPADDPEVLFYEKTKSFCFQGHPEYGVGEHVQYFFEKLKELGVKP